MQDFESLYKAYYMKIYSYVMTIVKDSSSAEEITQKTFFKALNAGGHQKYRGKSSEYTWLASIARNLAMDRFRAQSRRGSMPEQEPADLILPRMYRQKRKKRFCRFTFCCIR